jgi:hypothetical protein
MPLAKVGSGPRKQGWEPTELCVARTAVGADAGHGGPTSLSNGLLVAAAGGVKAPPTGAASRRLAWACRAMVVILANDPLAR